MNYGDEYMDIYGELNMDIYAVFMDIYAVFIYIRCIITVYAVSNQHNI